MGAHILDVDLDNFHRIPSECRTALFWEMDPLGDVDPGVGAQFEKEEWFSSTLLEWGSCGKLVVEGDDVGVGFAEYAPATLFPRVRSFAAGEAVSPADAVYLAYCHVVEGRREHGLGTALLREVARAAVERGYRAVEAIGDRSPGGGWVIPVTFLAAGGFTVVRDDERYPLLRLDLHEAAVPLVTREEIEIPSSQPFPSALP